MKLKREDILMMFKKLEESKLGVNMFEAVHTEEDIANAVYRVAPKVYYKNRGRFDRSYEKDDFVQDAYMHIQKLFDTGYIQPDRENIDGIIYSLLNSHFVLNKISSQSKDANRFSWSPQMSPSEDHSSRLILNPYDKTASGQIADKNMENPEEAHDREELEEHGKMIIDTIIDNMSFQSYTAKKHSYSGHDEILGDIELSEANLAKLYFMGYSLQAVLEVFGFGEKDRSSRSSYVTHKYQDVRYKINEIIYGLDKYDKEAVGAYVDSIEGKMASYQNK